jgi:hypothetical protein
MNERLLQFIWQFQYFNKSELASTDGEAVQIIAPGQFNTNQGPDFLDAKIKIGSTTWAGSVELHIRTSDWERHRHQHDENFRNVILHVVWEDDSPRIAVETIPILQLRGRVSAILMSRYESMMKSQSFISCENSVHTIPGLIWTGWKERLLAERLIRKSELIQTFLTQNNFHWEETFWWLLARNFGIPVNSDAFEAIARSLPLSILSKHKSSIHQLEGLLLGQSGLLKKDFIEDYPTLLKREYLFLAKKYSLQPLSQPVHFLRMRPVNFPELRLAQLAQLVAKSSHLFSPVKDATTVGHVRNSLDVTANDYWHYHYRFDETSVFKEKRLGESMIDNILINTVCPALFTYGDYHRENKYKEKALQWLEATSAEKNNITNRFPGLGISNLTASDSQALIELKKEYCDRKRCLECSIGNFILKSL